MAQSTSEYFDQGYKYYKQKNYMQACQYFNGAFNKQEYFDRNWAHFLMAKCIYHQDGVKFDGIVEKHLSEGLKYEDIEVLRFYVKEYGLATEQLNSILYKNEYKRKHQGEANYLIAIACAKVDNKDKALYYFNSASQVKFELASKDVASLIRDKYPLEYYTILLRYGNKVPYNIQIKNYVELEINEWQKKGKFEKTSDYKVRVSEVNRVIKAKELVQSFIDSIGSQKISVIAESNDYDPDNEVFKIKLKGKVIYLPVPIDEAPSFDANFKNLQYANKRFTLNNENFDILSFEIVNPVNNKTYIYDSKEALAFNSNDLNLSFDAIDIYITSLKLNEKAQITEGITTINVGKSDVDDNIPESATPNRSKFALIIGNENYQKYQTGLKVEQNVEFALRDALTFKEYCIKTIGIPSDNIIFKANAGVVQMQQGLNQINNIIKNMDGEAEVIVYYAGHGFPDEKTNEPYLIPVDVSSSSLNMALPLNKIVGSLTEYPSKQVVLFLDACFTGGGRDMGLLASRGVKIIPKETELLGNLVIFSACSFEQSALPHREKGHGLFTYFLLKKIQETEGDVSLHELDEYLSKQVAIKSTLIHSREQNPKTRYSSLVSNEWQNWKMRRNGHFLG
jgi:ribosomal protein S26